MKKRRGVGGVKKVAGTIYNKIKFKSKLELFMYKQLKEAKIKFDYEKHKFVLIKGFSYGGRKIRSITYTPDFVLKDHPVVIETKGFITEVFRIKMKLFKWFLTNENDVRDIYMPRNQKQCLEVIEIIKQKYKI